MLKLKNIPLKPMCTKGSEALFKKRISKGSAIVYVIIIMVPVLLAAISILDLVSTNFSAENIVEKGTQAKYNAEAGIDYGIRMLQAGGYTTDYDYDTAYLFFDDAENKENSRSYASITIKQTLIDKNYIINSEGFYMGVKNRIEKTINKKYLFNLSRKFTSVRASVLSKVNFKVAMNYSAIRLPEKSRFLILGDVPKAVSDIKLYTNNSGDIQWQNSSEAIFVKSSIYRDRLWGISTKNTSRGIWIPSENSIMYYVSEKGANTTIDLNNIDNSTAELYRGFRDYSGVVEETGILYNNIRLMFIDGDITIRGIRGDYSNNSISMAQKYLNNIVIYCKGKLTIDDCILAAYDDQKNLIDLNIALIADEMEFIISNGSTNFNEVSYMDGNTGLLMIHEGRIINLIKQNTDMYSDWCR